MIIKLKLFVQATYFNRLFPPTIILKTKQLRHFFSRKSFYLLLIFSLLDKNSKKGIFMLCFVQQICKMALIAKKYNVYKLCGIYFEHFYNFQTF
jgi:hypothetical protein